MLAAIDTVLYSNSIQAKTPSKSSAELNPIVQFTDIM